MISTSSKLFVSHETNYKEMGATEILDLIEKNDSPYALSYHNGFRQFDNTKIEKPILRIDSIYLLNIVIESPNGVKRTIRVSADKKIFTVNRGYIEADRLKNYDVFVDIECNYCKMIENKKSDVAEFAVDFSVLYNRSYFCNGILMRSE